MTRLLVAQFCSHTAEGHGRYRIHGPGRWLSRLPGVTVVDADPYHRRLGWLFENADVLVLHGVNPELYPVVVRRRRAGKVTTFEACDNYFDVQGWNPHVQGWLDRTLHDQFWLLVSAADAVQTSTLELANLWRPRARRVVIFDNGLDAVPPLTAPPRRPLTVGWAGSLTHLPDWFRTAPILEKWVRDRPGTRLAAMTDVRAEGFVRLPPDRYLFRKAGTWDDYRAFLREIDVGVVPLLPSPFNRGRTDLKFLEYAAHGVVGVYADTPPYRGTVTPGETGLLFRTDAELVAALDRLAADTELRNRIRTGGHAAAAARTMEQLAAARRDVYLDLLGGAATGPDLPTDILHEAEADGRYFVLRPGLTERLIQSIQGEKATPARVAELERLVAREPDYPPAVRQLARMLNDLGRHAEAVAVTDRLLAAHPDSPAGWTEAARARLALGDPQAARYALDRALAGNPAHPSAWAMLMRLLGNSPDAAGWAGRMARMQSENYMTALAAVRFCPPADRPARLRQILDAFAPKLMPEERSYAAAAFGQVFADAIDLGDVGLLARAAELFPESARLADLHGSALHAAGDADAAAAAFARAAAVARTGQTFQLEAAAVEGRQFLWQVGEYLERHAAGE